MDKKFQIGEIARFFDMPASTFRYWEDKGILHPRKKIENQYREYAIEDLMTISDVIFYKNLGLELKEIRGMDAATDYYLECIKTIYSIKHKNGAIRRVNINIAATTVENYRLLKEAGIENTDISRV